MYHKFILLLNGDLSPILGSGNGAAAPDAASAAGDAVNTAAGAVEPAGGLFGGGSMIGMILIYAAIFVGAYFLLMRPQRKREKKMKEMQSALKVGDNVVTSGGFFGRIADVGEDCFIVEFGTNRGIRIPIQKSDVLGVRSPKTTPPPKEALEKKDD